MWEVGYACKDNSNRESHDDRSYDDGSSSKESSCHRFDLLPGQVSRFPRLINDVRKIDFSISFLVGIKIAWSPESGISLR